MQSTGQTSTQAVSFVSIQGSVMMNGMLASLRNVRDCMCPAIQLRQPDQIGRRSGPEPANYTGETSRGQLRVAQAVVHTSALYDRRASTKTRQLHSVPGVRVYAPV